MSNGPSFILVFVFCTVFHLHIMHAIASLFSYPQQSIVILTIGTRYSTVLVGVFIMSTMQALSRVQYNYVFNSIEGICRVVLLNECPFMIELLMVHRNPGQSLSTLHLSWNLSHSTLHLACSFSVDCKLILNRIRTLSNPFKSMESPGVHYIVLRDTYLLY